MHPSFKLKGESGGVIIANTDEVTGDFEVLQPITDVAFTSYTCSSLSGGTLVGTTIPAGLPIYGRFSKIKLSSGVAIAYRAGRV